MYKQKALIFISLVFIFSCSILSMGGTISKCWQRWQSFKGYFFGATAYGVLLTFSHEHCVSRQHPF